MQIMRQNEPNSATISRRWALGLTFVAFLLQVFIVLLLNWRFHNKQEISSDVSEYRIYVANPTVLLDPPPEIKMYGGWVAAPLMPLLLTIIYRPLEWLGASEFLAFRGTMIFWNTLGFGLSITEIFRRWGHPCTKRDKWLALALTCSPLTWLPSAVLAQDECVASMWCGLCLVCWCRWGVWGCWAAAALGMFGAKPFFVVYFVALWMAYPLQRKNLFLASGVVFAILIGFMYLRDGELYLLRHYVGSYISGSLYSLTWLLEGDVTSEAARFHLKLANQISKVSTLLAITAYTLGTLRVRFTFPSALVGIYCVMFSVMVGMMPEYELWYWAWSMLLIWIACRRGEWLLGSLLYLHSCLGYAYKILYSCDSKNFYNVEFKPTAIWYAENIALDLWWVMVLLSIFLFLNTFVLAVLLWKRYPQLIEQDLDRSLNAFPKNAPPLQN